VENFKQRCTTQNRKFWMKVFCKVTSCSLVHRPKQFRGEEGGKIFLKNVCKHAYQITRSHISKEWSLNTQTQTPTRKATSPCVIRVIMWTKRPNELTLNFGLGWGTINIHGAEDAVGATLEVSSLSQTTTLTYMS